MNAASHNPTGRETCPYCAGTGAHLQERITCTRCNGEGLLAQGDKAGFLAPKQEDPDVLWHREQMAKKGTSAFFALGTDLMRTIQKISATKLNAHEE